MIRDNRENDINYNIDIDLALSYICDILDEESKKISIINDDVKKLEDRVNHYSNLKYEEEKKRNDSKYYFVTSDSNSNDLYNNELDKIIDKIKGELAIIINKYKKCEIKLNKVKYIEQTIYQYKISSSNKNADKNSEIGLQILETQELERSRIARDLHDSTIQSLTSLIHRTELCTRLLDIDVIRTKLELVSMTNSLRTIINDMRNIIYNLKPMSLEDLGLRATVTKFLDGINKVKPIQTELIVMQEEKELSDIANLTLFRVIQEACNNIIKHAEADRIIITLDYQVNNIIVKICDNGKGFCIDKEESEKKETGHGLGISIMKERVILLSGDMKIETKLGKGTIIIINIPINN